MHTLLEALYAGSEVEKILYHWRGNFLPGEANVLQGEKFTFDQQILMNNNLKISDYSYITVTLIYQYVKTLSY